MPTTVRKLDLSLEAVHNHWYAHGVAQAVRAMEVDENWTVDGQSEVEAKIRDLTAKLSSTDSDTVTASVYNATSDVVDFMGYLKSGRALLFFRWLTDVNPNLASVLVHEARDSADDYGLILLERLRVLERQHIIARVFAPERIALVLEIMSEINEEAA